MKNSINIIFIILVLLSLFGVSLTSFVSSKFVVALIIIFAVIKFYLVGFHFMELKKAHRLWKYLYVFYGVLIGTILILTF